MGEVAFHTKEEALAYAKENGIAESYNTTVINPETNKEIQVNVTNIEPRGVGYTILDDSKKGGADKPTATPTTNK